MTSALLDSLQLTVVAMGIVFASLFALSLLMSALPKLVGREKPVAPAERPEQVKEAVEVTEPDNALAPATVAVIASAIAAYLGQAPENLNVVAIRRVGSGLSPWTLNVRRESVQN